RGAMGGKVKAVDAPLLDLLPRQMAQSIPGIAHIPVVCPADIIGDEERRGREAKIGENRIGIVGERRVAVVEGQQKRASYVVRRACELVQRQGAPSRARQ